MAKKSESYGWIPFWSHINFSNWAAQLCGISREALQLSTFDSEVTVYPPSFPQALAEETLATWISESQTLLSGKKRHICVAVPCQSPNPAGLGTPPGAGDAPSSKAPGTPQPNCSSPSPSQPSGAKVNSGLASKGLQLQLWPGCGDNSLTHFLAALRAGGSFPSAVSAGCSWDVPSPPRCSFDGGITHQHPPILYHSAYTAAAAKIHQDPILLQICSLKA